MPIQISRRAGFGLAGLAVLLVFIADTRTPSGVTDWLLYALPLSSVRARSKQALLHPEPSFEVAHGHHQCAHLFVDRRHPLM
jgi:hypothetical protein